MDIVNKLTLKGLKKNKTRTIVTIIGVLLSAAMITAVTTLISSMQNYMIKLTIVEEGDWHAAIHNVSYHDIQTINDMDDIQDIALVKSGGYAVLEGSKNEYKPYLYIMEFDDKAFDIFPVHLISGRLPQNENEVVISEHIFTNGGVRYQLGDVLTLEVGQRITKDGYILNQKNSYVDDDDGVSEHIQVNDTREFTVVGVCKRLSYTLEDFSAPGYSLITMLDRDTLTDGDTLSIYLKAKNPAHIYEVMDILDDNFGDYHEYNNELLRYMGISNINTFNAVLYGLGTIIIILIMFGSVSLIYNSFAISVSERKKQFGLLSSVGATSKQLKRAVFFEAFVIAGIGIPLGIICGILGIGVTLYFIDNLLSGMVSTDIPLALTLSVSIPSVVVAVFTAIITIFISAYIPAWRVEKISAMDAIRQSTDIKLTAKQVKTSRLIRKLFGIEGDLALKNLKRNRRRYRSTVISLFISIVLFISASAFCMYLNDSVTNVYQDEKYDLSYRIQREISLTDTDIKIYKEVYKDILKLNSVNQGSVVKSLYGHTELSKEQLDESYYQQKVNQGMISEGQDAPVRVEICIVDHDTFLGYVNELGLDESQFINPDLPTGIVIDKQHYYDQRAKKYKNTNIIKEQKVKMLSIDNWYAKDPSVKTDIMIAAFADTAPFGIVDYSYENTIKLIIDDKISESAFLDSDQLWNEYMYFKSDRPFEAQQDIEKILSESGLPTSHLVNIAQILQGNRNFITIISVFSYGFIILISLITIANVFNTISTNVNLRRREFAMLKSVGMTNKSFNKMLNFECIFYGIKALLYGLPVSILFTYLIYQRINDGVDMPFYLPIQGIIISVLSVFLVVFISMMYSMSKIRTENITAALKNENL